MSLTHLKVYQLKLILRPGPTILGTKENIDTGQVRKKIVHDQEYILLPLLTSDPLLSKSSKDSPNDAFKPSGEEEKMVTDHPENEESENIVYGCIDDPNMPNLEEIVYPNDDEEVSVEADLNNLATIVPVSPIPTTRVYKDHPLEQIIRDIHSAPQTRRMTKNVTEHVEPKKMDVKSAFLYGTIEEEVYVCQSLGFETPEFPNKVYKVEKALFGLHQSPRAWYETLSTYLLDNGFRRGTINKTLFIKKDKGDILLVQVYVDDIIFGSTKKFLCTEFEQMMHKRFQMSSIGELTFFLGLQVKQKDDGIFISQDKYVADILKKFDFATVKTTSTLMETNKALLKDEEAADVDVHLYRSMIGSLMYLTAFRPDIMFAVCACARLSSPILNMSIVPNAKDYREKINRESEIYFLVLQAFTYHNNNNNNIVFETRVSKHTQSHIQLVSSDTTRPPHHHVAAVVAAADSTASSTGRTGAEHN
ncbi:putative ribonuclease H-like domain-containing protein [Tanacetum coccineum]